MSIKVNQSLASYFIWRTKKKKLKKSHKTTLLSLPDRLLGLVMVNYLVWGLFLTTKTAHATKNVNQSESRFVEVIIRDLEEPEFIHQIEDKVILFPNELRAVLEKGGSPRVNLKTSDDHKARIRRSFDSNKWNQVRYRKIRNSSLKTSS